MSTSLSTTPPLWRGNGPLLLASTSITRRKLLESAGLPVETEPPEVDERAIGRSADRDGAPALALRLATEKALAVSRRRPQRIVIGADQTLEVDGERLHKPADEIEAREQLARLSGRTHALHSAVAIAQDGGLISSFVDSAFLTMRALSPAGITAYVAMAGAAATASVGGYQIETLGIHLFERIAGDHTTILGLPLLPLLATLRDVDFLAL